MNKYQSDLLFCHQTRYTFRPFAVIDGKELVSYAFPENEKIFVMAREVPGDPATMRKYQIKAGTLVPA